MVLVDLVRKRTLETLGWDESVLDNLINATDDTLHDPISKYGKTYRQIT